MHLEEKTLASEQIFDGKVVKLFVDKAKLEDGAEVTREVIRHPGGVCVVPLDEEGNVLFVKQFRYPHGQVMTEIPAGKLEWGDADGVIQLLKDARDGVGFGTVLGNGCEAVGLALGAERIPTVKHQAISGYEPRNTKGTGINYATCPQGADHTAALTMDRAFDDRGRAAQAYASNKLQVAICFSDSMMCLFAFSHIVPKMYLLADMMSGLYGGPKDITRVTVGLGVKTLLTERAFNKLCGFTAEDDKLPEFFLTQRSAATGAAFDINPVEMEVLFDF